MFDGYLVGFIDGSDVWEFPQKYLAKEPVITPEQRTDAQAYRDAAADLHRVVIDNHKTKIELTMISGLTLAQKAEIDDIMRKGLISGVERKYAMRFWDDDPVAGGHYDTGDFYLADPSYTYKTVGSGSLVYNSFTYTFVQY